MTRVDHVREIDGHEFLVAELECKVDGLGCVLWCGGGYGARQRCRSELKGRSVVARYRYGICELSVIGGIDCDRSGIRDIVFDISVKKASKTVMVERSLIPSVLVCPGFLNLCWTV